LTGATNDQWFLTGAALVSAARPAPIANPNKAAVKAKNIGR